VESLLYEDEGFTTSSNTCCLTAARGGGLVLRSAYANQPQTTDVAKSTVLKIITQICDIDLIANKTFVYKQKCFQIDSTYNRAPCSIHKEPHSQYTH